MAKAQYVRLYADADGKSHFSDEEIELRLVNFAPPAPPLNVSAFTPTKHFALLSAPRGWIGDWHPTPTRQFVICYRVRQILRLATVRCDALSPEASCS